MKAITGRDFEGKLATLRGWARYKVANSVYPAIKAEAEGAVEGKLYWELDEHIFDDLDQFEGDKYERIEVDVTLEDGSSEKAYTFAFKQDCLVHLSDEPWNYEDFLNKGLEKYIRWFVEDRKDFDSSGEL
jgi:gamma-glutamylcyclotransferase (GGCT)/AIG2-like uncharacterized protein YtfP